MADIKEAIRLVENLYTAERVIQAMEKEPRQYNTEYILYTNEVHTLKAIAQNEGVTQKQLTDEMFRTKGATSVMIQKLEKKGLVTRRPDEEDARLTRLYLTDEGRKVNDSHVKYDEDKIKGWMNELAFTEEELTYTNKVLERFIGLIKTSVLADK